MVSVTWGDGVPASWKNSSPWPSKQCPESPLQLLTSHLPCLDSTFLVHKGRGWRSCLLSHLLLQQNSVSLCHQLLLNSLFQCKMSCRETKFISLSANTATPLGCFHFSPRILCRALDSCHGVHSGYGSLWLGSPPSR